MAFASAYLPLPFDHGQGNSRSTLARAHMSQNLFEEQWVTVNGLPMFARVSQPVAEGTPAVVLVHGLSVSGLYMLPTAERLAPFYPTYVPDLPGFGKSAKPPHIFDIPEIVDALAAWMRLMGL